MFQVMFIWDKPADAAQADHLAPPEAGPEIRAQAARLGI